MEQENRVIIEHPSRAVLEASVTAWNNVAKKHVYDVATFPKDIANDLMHNRLPMQGDDPIFVTVQNEFNKLFYASEREHNIEKSERMASFPQRDAGLAAGRLLTVLLAVTVYAGMQLLREGILGNSYLSILLGAIGAIIATLVYTMESLLTNTVAKSAIAAFLWAIPDLLSLISMAWIYILGAYLFFYQGLWHFTEISNGASPVATIFSGLVFTLLGYAILYTETKLYGLLNNWSKSLQGNR